MFIEVIGPARALSFEGRTILVIVVFVKSWHIALIFHHPWPFVAKQFVHIRRRDEPLESMPVSVPRPGLVVSMPLCCCACHSSVHLCSN